MSKAYDFGTCNEGVYMVLGWIQGFDMEEEIIKLNPMEQYQLGCEAGEILKKIHDVQVDVEPICGKKNSTGKSIEKFKCMKTVR